jgi:hypothetical protein
MPTEGSLPAGLDELLGIGRIEKVTPLFSETTSACLPPQFLFGT